MLYQSLNDKNSCNEGQFLQVACDSYLVSWTVLELEFSSNPKSDQHVSDVELRCYKKNHAELEFIKLDFHAVNKIKKKKKKKKKPRWNSTVANMISVIFLKWKLRLINSISRELYLLHILILPSSHIVPLSLTVPLSLSHTVLFSRSGLSQSSAFLHGIPLSLRSRSQSHIV